MDKLNLDVYVEQVNHEVNETTTQEWEQNDEQALSNVIDPNTEFKTKDSSKTTLVNPSNSYGLTNEDKILEQTKKQRHLNQDLIRRHSECLDKELEQTLEGYKNRRKRSVPDSSLVAKVHAYTSSHLPAPEEQDMDPEALTNFDSQNKLLKYPPDRITVVTEKCSYLTRSPSRTKALDSHRRHGREPDSPLSGASSHESMSTASVASGHVRRRSSLISNHSNVMSETSCRLDRSMTTADQLAWEFRRARDRLDTASNMSGCSSRFELDSNYSERAETMSTISDVSGYEEEMFRIKRLLLLDSSTPTPPHGRAKDHQSTMSPEAVTTQRENVEIQIHRLTVQLQNALAEKEKCKMEAMAAENKMSLEWQGKLQEALRQRAHLEGRLETVQVEMSSLANERKEVLDRNRVLEQELKQRAAADGKSVLQEMERLASEISRLQQSVREVENKNEDLGVQLELKDSEIRQWRAEAKSTEDANEKLRIELQELRVESESKDGAVQGLKAKISDQHIEFQSLLQAKLKAENNLGSLKNEVESVRKSEHWYRDQLHACQAAKVKVQQELMSSQSNAVLQSHLIEKLKVDVANMQQSVEETQNRAVREKEALMRKLEVIQADMLEREATIFGQIHSDSTTETIDAIASKLKKIEEEKNRMMDLSDSAVKELKEEVATLKNEVRGKEAALEAAGAENSQLMVRLTTLQKTMNERELVLQLMENKHKNVETSHNRLVENLKAKDQSLLELKNEKVAVEVALAAAGREKTEVDAAIVKLREDFARITAGYQSMKMELREKDKQVLSVKENVAGLEREKRGLVDRIGEFRKVEEELRVLQGRMSQTQAMEEQVEHLTRANRDLSMKVNELNEAHGYVKDQMSKMEETIAAREEQLLNQTKNFEVHAEELKKRDQLLMDAQNEKASLEENLSKLNATMKELSEEKEKCASEVDALKKQVSSANGAIEQFNLLCRKSEEEKNELKQMLEKEKTPTTNGSILISNELPKTISQFENGCVQTNLRNLYDLIKKSELKVMSLVSDAVVDRDNRLETEENSCVVEFDSVLSRIVNIDENLTKALTWKMEFIRELKSEKEANEVLRNESKVRLSSQEKISNISCSIQTDSVSVGSTATQTVNDDVARHKDQIDLYVKEMNRLKASLKMSEIEHREKHRKYESNVRTLLRKVKEHMRGRKVAERALEELRGRTEDSPDQVQWKTEIEELRTQLEASRLKYEEQTRMVEKNQEAMLELEKERGKLAQSCSISQKKVPTVQAPPEENVAASNEFDQKTRELQMAQIQARVSELEEQVHKLHFINKDLRKEIFTEKCESSQLRKQVASLQMGLDTANDMLDTKKAELTRSESVCSSLRTDIALAKQQLQDEQQAHDESKQETEQLQALLEETKAKDPVLADQIKTLSYHLHQKSQEAAGLQENLRLCEERWSATETGLQRNLSALQEELTTLRTELDSVRANKFALQTQAAELRAALQSSIEQNKVLRLKLETFGCESKDRLPDLTSSLPLAPTKYDESRIAELLQQSTVLPHNKPLNNLQCCLDSLKEEMAVLQRQIAAKTSRDGEQSNIKDV